MTDTEFLKRYTRKFVCDHLDYHGALRKLLTNAQQWEAFCLGDGFGERTSAELEKINSGWDWSHVRDSSDAALTRMAEYILKAANWKYASVQHAAGHMLGELRQAGIDPETYFSA